MIMGSLWYHVLTDEYNVVKTLLETNNKPENKERFYACGMLCLLNQNLTSDNIIELLIYKLIYKQWLGLYLLYNPTCHADDVIKFIKSGIVHPYFVFMLNGYNYNTPKDFIKLYNTYNEQEIAGWPGYKLKMNGDVIINKPFEFIIAVNNELPDIDYNIKTILNIAVDRQHTCYTSTDNPDVHRQLCRGALNNIYKYTNNINDINLFLCNHNNMKNKICVRINETFIKDIYEKLFNKNIILNNNNILTLDNLDCLLYYIGTWWTYFENQKLNVTNEGFDKEPEYRNINIDILQPLYNNELLLLSRIVDAMMEFINNDN